jgi:hypothetical protein
MRKTLVGFFALALSATVAQAQAPWAPVLGKAGVYNDPPGYGAYDGKVAGYGSTFIADGLYKFWCVDAAHAVPGIASSSTAPTDDYFATAFQQNSANRKGDGTFGKTRQGSATNYLKAAWLIEKFEGGGNSASWTAENVQKTIWNMMGAGYTGFTDLSSSINVNYASQLTRDWFVLSDDNACTWQVGNSCYQRETSNQEYLMYTTKPAIITSTPEPSTYALMGAGLLAMGFAAKRRRRVSA